MNRWLVEAEEELEALTSALYDSPEELRAKLQQAIRREHYRGLAVDLLSSVAVGMTVGLLYAILAA